MEEQLKTGTTTLALKGKDFTILAADRRVTAGNYMPSNNGVTKLLEITNDIAVTIAGTVSEIQLLTKYLKSELKLAELRNKRKTAVREAANLLASWTYTALRARGGVAHFIAGGFDKEPQIYDISPDGVVFEIEDYVSSGSGSLHAISVLDTKYRRDMTEQEATDLAIEALVAAMTRDNASGHGYNVWVINKDGITKKLDKKLERVFK